MTAAKHEPTPQEETLARSDALLPRSLQTIIDSPNFRDYEKAMARKLLLKRNSHDALVAENQALRNLASNLQPGPISEALVGARYERESALVAALESLKPHSKWLHLVAERLQKQQRDYSIANTCEEAADAIDAAINAAKAAP